MRHLLGAVVVLWVAGCSGLNDLNGPEPLFDRSVIGSNTALTDVGAPQSGLSGTLVQQFHADLMAARATTATPAQQIVAFNSGAAVVNARCQFYFRGLGVDARNLSFAQSQLQLLTGGLTTILALVNASQTAVAAVAAGSTALLTGMKQFGDAYYFSADVASVEQLVSEASRNAMTEVNKTENWPLNFSATITMLISYQSICQPHTIKNLINGAVNNGRTFTKFDGPTTDGPPGIDLAITRMRTLFGLNAQTNPTAIAALAAVYETPPANFSVLCGYLYGKVSANIFAFPSGKAPKVGEPCPEGTTFAFDASNPTMKSQFEREYSGLVAADRAFWGNLRSKVVSATTVADVGSTSPPSGIANEALGMVRSAPLTWNPPAATTQIQRGRVSGFSVGIKPSP
jgi:hypothetical protein